MTSHDTHSARIADRLKLCPTSTMLEHRVTVDAGELEIVHVCGTMIDTYVMLITDPNTGDLVSVALYPYLDEDVDVAFHTGATVLGASYIYSAACGGRIDTGDESVEGTAIVVFTSGDTPEQGGR